MNQFNKNKIARAWWWKIITIVCLVYTCFYGFTGKVPAMVVLHETIRNLYFHVTMWMAMMLMMLINAIYSIKYLSSLNKYDDLVAEESGKMAMVFSAAGLITGMVWANFTWGAPWTNDPQLNGTAATILMYAAYFILRNAIPDDNKKAKIAGVYAIFAFVMMFVFIMVIPKMYNSLHPGKGGNPGFNKYDLDSDMRRVFYPAVIGWCLLGTWLMSLKVRIRRIKEITEEN